MNGRRVEHRYNTPEQVVEYLTEALSAIDAAGVPPELREAAFVQAVGLVAGKSLTVEQVAPLPAALLGPPRV